MILKDQNTNVPQQATSEVHMKYSYNKVLSSLEKHYFKE